MKRLLLLGLLLSFCQIISVSAQTDSSEVNYPIIDTSSVWRVIEFCCFGSGLASELRFDTEATMVDDKPYFQLLRKLDESDEWNETEKFLREENGKIWIKENGIASEDIFIFDHNLMPGDSFFVRQELEIRYLVTSIDSITLSDGSKRKRWKLSCFDAFEYEWIEGVGGLSQIGFYHTYYGGVFDVGVSLCNYAYNEEIVHEVFTCVSSTEEVLNPPIELYPNPAQDMLFIDSEYTIDQAWISDLTGKMIHFKNIESSIDVSSLSEGHYTLRFLTKDGQYSYGRFVKL